jgi:hypothetical protein
MRQPESKVVPTGIDDPTKLDLGQMGLPAQVQHMIVVNRFREPGDPRNVSSPVGLAGKYKVTLVLGRPGFNLLPERQYSFARGLKGDSHLAIAKPAFSPPGNPDADQIMIRGTTEDGNFEFTGLPNEKGFLGKFVASPFDATGFHDAERKAHRALATSLSNWSVHLDIPLHIVQVESEEVRTGNTQTSILTASFEAPLAITPTATLRPEFRGYASLYREALNTNSPVYQFLCLFKMIEGMLKRRGRLGREASLAGIRPTRMYETIPDKIEDAPAWLNAIFPIHQNWDSMALTSIFPNEVLGKNLKQVIDKILYPIRLDVAHAISSNTGELTLSIDELLHTQNINKWLPLTKSIVRRMLKNDFPEDFLSYLKEDGTIIG